MLIGIDASRAFSSFIGGPENYSYYLVKALLLAKSRHHFRLYLQSSSTQSPRFKRLISEITTENFDVCCIPLPRLWTQVGLALECLRNTPDVLLVPAHTIPIVRKSSLKTITVIHDLGAEYLPNYHRFPQRYYLNFATDYAINNASLVVAVSEYTKKDILSRYSINSAKVRVSYEGFDKELFHHSDFKHISQVKSKYGISGDYLLFVGTIQPRKNLSRLISAFSMLVNEGSVRNIDLVLAGSPGWLYDDIYKTPKKFGIANRVKFIGRVEDSDLPSLYSGSKSFIFPSLFEGFGLSLLEAMSCGTPVVTSNMTSLPEVGGSSAIYVDPYNVVDIANGIKKVLDLTGEARDRLIENNYIQANKFDWQQTAKDFLSYFELF